MSKFRYWGITNIKMANYDTAGEDAYVLVSCRYCKFLNEVGNTLTVDASKETVNHSATPYKFFGDTNVNFLSKTVAQGATERFFAYYDFTHKVSVSAVEVMSRADVNSVPNHVWKEADIMVSDDASDWELYGKVYFSSREWSINISVGDIIKVGRFARPGSVPYRYWKVADFSYTEEGTQATPLNSFYFIDENGVRAKDPSKYDVFSRAPSFDLILDENNGVDYFSAVDAIDPRAYISYDFETPTKVVAVNLVQSNKRTPRLNGMVVYGSNDNITWNKVGTVDFKGALRSTRIVLTGDRTDDLRTYQYDPSVKWYNCLPDVTCLFAIDASSTINPDGTVQRLDNSGGVLTPGTGTEFLGHLKKGSRVSQRLVHTDDHNNSDKKFYRYSTLEFRDHSYSITPPVGPFSSYTAVIRVFMQADRKAKGSEYSDFDAIWFLTSVDGFQPLVFKCGKQGGIYPNRTHFRRWGTNLTKSREHPVNRANPPTCLDFFSSTYDRISNTLREIAGSAVMDPKPAINGNGAILNQSKMVTTIGTRQSRSSDSYMEGAVVALGIFDRELTTEELFKVLAQIDGEFLTEVEEPTPKAEGFGLVGYNTKTAVNLDTLKVDAYSKPSVLGLPQSSYHVNLSGEDLVNIKDVVTKEDEPIVAKLFLYEKYTGVLVRHTWSDTEGKFSFKNVPKGEYIVTSFDPGLQYKSIIKDFSYVY